MADIVYNRNPKFYLVLLKNLDTGKSSSIVMQCPFLNRKNDSPLKMAVYLERTKYPRSFYEIKVKYAKGLSITLPATSLPRREAWQGEDIKTAAFQALFPGVVAYDLNGVLQGANIDGTPLSKSTCLTLFRRDYDPKENDGSRLSEKARPKNGAAGHNNSQPV